MTIIRPRWGSLPLLFAAMFAVPSSAQDYADLVLADKPFAYWRLDEDAQGAISNSGTSNITATAVGGDLLELGVPGLADPNNPAMRFKGLDVDQFDEDGTISGSRVNIADNALSNAGGPYTEKTFEMWFSADNANPDSQQIIFEQGGSTRGVTIYVYEGEVVAGVHNSNNDDGGVSTPWPGGTGAERELALVKSPIESNTPYHIALVYDGDEDGFEGTVTGYLNGELMGQVDGIGRLFAHTDDTHIGGGMQTLFEDGGVGTDIDPELHYFEGVIDDVALYDRALSAGRIGVHLGNPVSADVNDDGSVNFADFLLISGNFNTPGTRAQGDVDFDDFVGMNDFIIWRRQFDAAGAGAAAVPEPSAGMIAFASLFALPLLRRRRAR